MSIYFSKTTGKFYENPPLNGSNGYPTDMVAIPRSRYIQLLSQQAQGDKIVGDSSGNPQPLTVYGAVDQQFTP